MGEGSGNMRAVVVAGPTCSGKSALALALAERLGGTIINADAMQVYRDLRVLTARPTQADEARAPHRLYGVRPAAENSTAAWWRDSAIAAMHEASAIGSLPILCGGTGLYFAALTQGLAPIPEPGEAARAEARALLKELGAAGLHARLMREDPATASGLRPSDSQRLARAWEVWRGTGRGLRSWQDAPAGPAGADFAYDLTAILLDPPREALRAAITRRCAAMVAEGVLDEVRALLALRLDPAVPAMRAHGVPEFSAALSGEITLSEATRRTALVTGQYTKRQATWFRHRDIAAASRTHRFLARYGHDKQFSESFLDETLRFIREAG
jgi:tRNA dimethylallyltransferase